MSWISGGRYILNIDLKTLSNLEIPTNPKVNVQNRLQEVEDIKLKLFDKWINSKYNYSEYDFFFQNSQVQKGIQTF